MKDLIIRVRLDRSQAKQAADEHVQDSQKMLDADRKAAAAVKQIVQKQARDQAEVDQAKVESAQRTGAARVQSATQAASAESRAHAKTGDAGVSAYTKVGVAAGLMQSGIMKALSVASSLSDVMREVEERYRKLTGSFTGQRDQLGELASIMGKDADNKFTLDNAKFNQQAGFRPDEGLQFRLGFQNAGAQFKGKNISDAEYDQFEGQAGQLAVARGFNPEQVGDLAGTLLGTKDRTKLGGKASEDALGKLNSGLAILGAGKGRNSVLTNQFSMLSSASMNEDELKGVFTDTDEVAIAVSTMAEKHDAQAAEAVKMSIQGLRDFDGKAKDLLAKAGIDAKTSWIKAIEQLAPVVEQEARERGVKVDDVLRENFDVGTADAIGVAINKGTGPNGVFAQRRQVAAANQGGDKALKVVADADKSERIQNRKADAGVVLAENEVGAANSRLEITRKQAEAELTKEGAIGTTASTVGKWASKIVTLGSYDTEEAEIQRRQAEIIQRRATAAGIDSGIDVRDADKVMTPEQRNRRMNEAAGKIEAGGGSAIQDMTKEQLETNRLLREQNELLRRQQQQPGPEKTPEPIGREPRANRPDR